MCLYTRKIINRKYTVNTKNGGIVPTLKDARIKYVPIGCGQCKECRKQKANQWRIRMHEELKQHKGYFVTLTFDPDELKKICDKYGLKECNAVAGKAVRMMTERHRQKYKRPMRHWFITELGQTSTERIHLHGIIFEPFDIENLEKIWGYGTADVGEYCNEQTINYIVKYVTKIDETHRTYRPQIFCSAGIGRGYTERHQFQRHKYNGENTRDFYILNDGTKVQNPIYYRNKLYSDEEREQLWIIKLDREEMYIDGIKVNVSTAEGFNTYLDLQRKAQQMNECAGYGNESDAWKKETYNITQSMLKHKEKVHNYAEIAYFDTITRKKAQKTH